MMFVKDPYFIKTKKNTSVATLRMDEEGENKDRKLFKELVTEFFCWPPMN